MSLIQPFFETSVTSLLNSTTSYAVGDFISVFEGDYAYKVVASGGDLTTAGGTSLEALPAHDGFLTFEQLGADPTGLTDSHSAFVAGAGRQVRGRADATYRIDVNSLADVINIASGTHWKFGGSKISYSHFGCPLFYSNLNDSNIIIDQPHGVYSGYAPDTLPYSSTEVRDALLIPKTGAIGTCCMFYFAGADNVEVISPRHEAVSPGSRYSQYAVIRLNNKYDAAKDDNEEYEVNGYGDADRGNYIRISDIHFDDCCMGILGGGYAEIDMPGTHYFGRYDDYGGNDTANGGLGYGAPVHRIYLSGRLIVDSTNIGNVYDKGDYLGTYTAPHSANTLKFRNCDHIFVSSLTSYSPHGVLDGEGYAQGHFGPIYWKGSDPSLLKGSPFRMSAQRNVSSVSFNGITLDLGAYNEGAIDIVGTASSVVSDYDLGRVRIIAAPTDPATLIQLNDCIRLRAHFEFELSGATIASDDVALKLTDCSNCDITITNLDPTAQLTRINETGSGTGNTIVIDALAASNFQKNFEIEHTGTAVFSPVRSRSGRLSRQSGVSSADFTHQLLNHGVFLITFTAYQGSNQAISSHFITNWIGPAGQAFATQIGSNMQYGSKFTGLSAAVDASGLMTFSVTTNSAISIDAEISVAILGGSNG